MILPGLINEITRVNCPKNNCDLNLYLQLPEVFDYTIAHVLKLIDDSASKFISCSLHYTFSGGNMVILRLQLKAGDFSRIFARRRTSYNQFE